MRTMVQDNFDGIKDILRELDDSEVVTNKGFNNMYIYNEYSSVYIKFNLKQVILSNIILCKQRNGYGTRILNILIDYCKKYSIKELIIESVLTEEMFNFCIKHGFTKILDEYNFNGEFFGNYRLIIK